MGFFRIVAISVIAGKLASVKKKYLVLSGKGGVGKSTFSSLLARAFATNPDNNVSFYAFLSFNFNETWWISK